MSSNETDLVSIIVPAYNAEKYIADTIKSVLQQTYPYFELIIVDDASEDRTVEIVRSFCDERIKLIRHKSNQGPGGARNTAIEAAKGRWMTVLDADDQYLPHRLEKLLQAAKEAGDGYFIADDLLISFETLSGLKPWRRQSESYKINFGDNDFLDLDLCRFLKFKAPGLQPFLPLDHVKKYGLLYDSSCFYGEDFEFVCHLFRTGLKLRLIKEPLYLYRLTPGSLTSKTANRKQVIEVYERLIAFPSFSEEEKQLFKKLLNEIKAEVAYSPFPQALKQRRYGEALRLAVKNPSMPLIFLCRLPKSIKYRLALLRNAGFAK
ncbi:MAG: glycosyltransferase family 2 protein [Thermoanaerobacteraceae bacterium]|nr:glycosyltransferase family 2 protein [Thermoanaerobacteraceae bacterium]